MAGSVVESFDLLRISDCSALGSRERRSCGALAMALDSYGMRICLTQLGTALEFCASRVMCTTAALSLPGVQVAAGTLACDSAYSFLFRSFFTGVRVSLTAVVLFIEQIGGFRSFCLGLRPSPLQR